MDHGIESSQCTDYRLQITKDLQRLSDRVTDGQNTQYVICSMQYYATRNVKFEHLDMRHLDFRRVEIRHLEFRI